MFLKSLRISEMRCFRHAEAEFQYPGRESASSVKYPNINVLLGNNGMGKTATLKAAALTALSPIIDSAGYVPYSIVRRDRRKKTPITKIRAEFLLHPGDVEGSDHGVNESIALETVVKRTRNIERIERAFEKDDPIWENMMDERTPAFLLIGYGASRTVEGVKSFDIGARRKARLLRYERVAGLFEEHATLIPLTAWLPEMESRDPKREREVVKLIDRLLPRGTSFKGKREDGEYLFHHRGLRVPFRAMSDGYRAYLGWICDLLYHICMCAPANVRLVDNYGVVLVDEVDLHLHPEWQLTLLPNLSQALPNLQFICTTHGPIVAGTVHSANLRLLLPDGAQASTLARPEAEIHGLNADQILLSPHFGLTSSRAPGFVKKLRRISKEARTGDPDAALDFTRMIAHGEGAADFKKKRSARPEAFFVKRSRSSSIRSPPLTMIPKI
ncbi:MAG: AAA family ATPase [Desulfobacterales bacterium]|nr:AAA family ATPase [Desulfobacterales bacterium]